MFIFKKDAKQDDLNANPASRISSQTEIVVHEDLRSENLSDEDEPDLENIDLVNHFQSAVQRTGCLFQRSQKPNSVISLGSNWHISHLPMELLLYILRWVVSTDLDMRSLDQCALVSKGFYIVARDPEIWRLACLRWVKHFFPLPKFVNRNISKH